MTYTLIREETDIKKEEHNVKTQTQRKDGHLKTEVEIGVTLPQDKEQLGQPGAGRGKEGSSLRGFRERMVLPSPLILVFKPLDL